MVGLGAPDDAAVWRLDDERALVVTTDFFTPVVDDPYDYGAVAAANALSDVYAMGAEPILALNITCLPPNLPPEMTAEIVRGAAEKVLEAGAVIAGGHSVQDNEPKVGLVAIGLGRPDQIMTKAAARPGQFLVLTKPIGSGVTATALKSEKAQAGHIRQMTDWMKTLNRRAAQTAVALGVHAATDVTGYSLLGHGSEMAAASGVRLHFFTGSVPVLTGARGYAQGNFVPGGTFDNRLHFGPAVEFEAGLDEVDQTLLFDAQTSGGLLVAMDAEALAGWQAAAKEGGLTGWVVGVVEAGSGLRVSRGLVPGAPALPVEPHWRGTFESLTA
jgi:selenide, water dikinase